MFTARKKIAKDKGADPDSFEESVAQVCAARDVAAAVARVVTSRGGCHPHPCHQALFDLEATNADLKADLRDLYITSAKEVDVSSSRKAIIIHVRVVKPTVMQRRLTITLDRCPTGC